MSEGKINVFELPVSVFPNVSSHIVKPTIVTLAQHLLDIQNGVYRKKVETLRKIQDKIQADQYKRKSMEATVFSGKMDRLAKNSNMQDSYRVQGSCSFYTNLMILDIDDVENPHYVRDETAKIPYTIASWISPSGKGVKVLVRISDYTLHKTAFEQLCKIYPNIDKSGSDLFRLCIVSYDPDMRVNFDAEVFTPDLTKNTQPTASTKYYQSVRDKAMQIIVDIINNSYEGNRNNSLLKASIIAGNYIEKGVLSEPDVINTLLYHIELKGETDEKRNYDTIQRGISYGKTHFYIDNAHKMAALIKNDSHPALTEAGDVNDFFVSKTTLVNDLDSYFMGEFMSNTPFIPLCNQSSQKALFKRAWMYVITGHSNIGKTTILLYLLSQVIANYRKKVLIYIQEDRPFSSMIQMIQYWSTKHIKVLKKESPDELERYIDFFNEYVTIIDNKKTLFTYEDILNIAMQKKPDVLLIDPYNSLIVNSREPYAYHYKALRSVSLFCSQSGTSVFINAHPNTFAQRRRASNVIQRPYVTDIEYGSMFKNVCDEAYVFHRDPFAPNEQDRNLVYWYIEKVRDKYLFGGDVTSEDQPIVMRYSNVGFLSLNNELLSKKLIV